ncbi:MAG: hypothetical protein Q7R58_02015 [bacterium]|nr:hypothetical protein [bacterium]
MQDLYTTVRDTLGGQGIGMDIIPWLAGDGKKSFVEKLKALGTEFNNARRIRLTDNKNLIWVNLDAPPKLPFDGAEVEENAGGGWVQVERRKTGLFVDGKRVILHFDEGQKGGKVMEGSKLAEALTGKSVEHPNVLDALIEHPHLIPNKYKQDGQGRIICIFFWAVKFRHRGGYLYVRYLWWRDGRWYWSGRWLGGSWGGLSPAAVRAS